MTQKDKEIKAIGLSIVANLLLNISSRMLKDSNKYYKKSIKFYINKILEELKPVINNIERIKNLAFTQQEKEKLKTELGYEIDSESISDGINVEQNIFINLVALYLKADDTKIYDLNNVLENYVNNKKIYTEQELFFKIKQIVKTIQPSIDYTDNYINDLIQ